MDEVMLTIECLKDELNQDIQALVDAPTPEQRQNARVAIALLATATRDAFWALESAVRTEQLLKAAELEAALAKRKHQILNPPPEMP